MTTTLNFSAQNNLFDPGFAKPVTVVGAGAVGSQVAIMLAKQGCKHIMVWDADTVLSHNVPMSAYRPRDVGRRKVEALAEIVHEYTGVRIEAIPRMFGQNDLLSGSVVACVDDSQ